MTALGLLFVATVSAGSVIPTPIGDDPYTDGGSGHQHKTQLEPDSFAFGQTIVALTHPAAGSAAAARATSSSRPRRTGAARGRPAACPGRRSTRGGPWPRISDPSIAYDPQDNVWLALGLGIDDGGNGHILLVNRSTDGGLTWSNPVNAGQLHGSFWDKTWITCDTWAQSPHYGNCYVEFDDNSAGNDMSMVTSPTVGSRGARPSPQAVLGPRRPAGRPAERARDRPLLRERRSAGRFQSTDGGTTWTGCTDIVGVQEHPVAGEHPHVPAPFGGGRGRRQGVRRLAGLPVPLRCPSNDIVYSSSLDGLTWSAVTRIPIDPVYDQHRPLPARIAVDKNTSGSATYLARGLLLLPGHRGTSMCEHERQFHIVPRRRRELDTGLKIGGPMKVPWIANTNQGYMVGDYISTSFTGDGKAHPVFSLAKAPDSGVNGSCYPNNTGCHQRLTSATLRHHAPAADALG